MTDEPELMGTAEIAELLGVSRQRVLQLSQQDGFPEPVAVLRMGKIWHARDMRLWADVSDSGGSNRCLSGSGGVREQPHRPGPHPRERLQLVGRKSGRERRGIEQR